MKRKVYLDYNATAPLRPEALEAMLPFLKTDFGNASSIHSFGRETRVAVDKARFKMAQLLGCTEGEIVFTSGGTEANNLAILGAARYAKFASQRRHIVTSRIEHHCVLRAVEHLEKREGFEVTWLPVSREGVINPDDVRRVIRDDTALVSVMWANNETGVIQPVETISAICRERGVLFHTDAVQAFGKIPTATHGVGLLALSAHKFGGPKGVGVLFLRKGTRLEPIVFGGSQELEKRSGTENVAGIVGMARAAELAVAEMPSEAARLLDLTEKFFTRLSSSVSGIHRNGDTRQRTPNTVSVSFEGVDGAALLMALDLEGVAVSSGSACAAGAIDPSHVLTAMGLPQDLAKATVRFSFGRETTREDTEVTIGIVERVVARLRQFAIATS